MENDYLAKAKKESYLESRLTDFRVSKDQLSGLLERLQALEVRISGEKARDMIKTDGSFKEEKGTERSSIIDEFQSLHSRMNTIIIEIGDSITHLEEYI